MSRAPSLSGPLPGPFHPRLEAASTAKDWADWAGVLSPRKLDATGREYFAIRNQAALIDISPMRKYRIEGSASRSGSAEPPWPVPVGSPPWAMKPSITRWKMIPS